MDDLCADATQFQCVILFCVLSGMTSLNRAGFSFPPPETHPNYDLYRHRLANGWFPGTQIVSLAF